MNQGVQHLKRIQDKLQLLLKQFAALKKENARLKEELDKTQHEAGLQQKHIEELKQQVNIMKISAGEMSGTDKKEFEKRITAYLKEIDRCIALLSD